MIYQNLFGVVVKTLYSVLDEGFESESQKGNNRLEGGVEDGGQEVQGAGASSPIAQILLIKVDLKPN